MLGDAPGRAGQPVGDLAADPARRHRLAPRRDPRDLALSDRRAGLSRPARHVLRAAGDGALGRRRDRRAQRVGGNDLARAFANLKSGLESPLAGMSDRVQLVAVRARRQPRAGLSRPAGGAGAEPLLQRPRRVAVDLHAASSGGAFGDGGDALGPGLYPGPARTDRRQPRKPAAHPGPRRGKPDRRQLDPGRA